MFARRKAIAEWLVGQILNLLSALSFLIQIRNLWAWLIASPLISIDLSGGWRPIVTHGDIRRVLILATTLVDRRSVSHLCVSIANLGLNRRFFETWGRIFLLNSFTNLPQSSVQAILTALIVATPESLLLFLLVAARCWVGTGADSFLVLEIRGWLKVFLVVKLP